MHCTCAALVSGSGTARSTVPGGSFTLNIPLKPLLETTLKIILIFLKKGVDKKAGFGYYYQRRLSGRDTNGV